MSNPWRHPCGRKGHRDYGYLCTPRELDVLKALWEIGPCSRGPVARKVYGTQEKWDSARALLRRLHSKGLVSREWTVVDRPYLWTSDGLWNWSAVITKDEFIEHELDTIIDRFCGGSRLSLIMHIIDHSRWEGDPEILEKLVDSYVDDLSEDG